MSTDFNSLRDPSDDLLDRAIQALLSQPAPEEIKRRVLDRAARWTATNLPLGTNGFSVPGNAGTLPRATLPGTPVPQTDEQSWAIPRLWLIVFVIAVNIAILVWILRTDPAAGRPDPQLDPAAGRRDSRLSRVQNSGVDRALGTDDVADIGPPSVESTETQVGGGVLPDPVEIAVDQDTMSKSPARSVAGISEAIRVEFDQPYAGTENPRQRLDLYVPRQPVTDEALPVVVIIHGTFQNADKRFGRSFANALVPSGHYAVASIDYRLPNEAKWPAQLLDCRSAVRWLRANARLFNLDPNRVGVLGASAGGHLAAMLGTMNLTDGLDDPLGEAGFQSSRVSCVVDLFGPTDFPTLASDDRATSALVVDAATARSGEAAKLNSPTSYVTSDDPPFLIIHGDADRVVPFQQAELLATTLSSAGVAVTLIPVEGGGHGNFRNPEVVSRIRQFFDRNLRNQDVEVSISPIEALGGR